MRKAAGNQFRRRGSFITPQPIRDTDSHGRHAIGEPNGDRDGEPGYRFTRPAHSMQQFATFVQRFDCQGIQQGSSWRQQPPELADKRMGYVVSGYACGWMPLIAPEK